MPLGFQMAVRHLAGAVIRNPIGSDIALVSRLPILGAARDALYSPAAQQMLRYQTSQLASGAFSAQGSAVASANSLYTSFQQEYQALLASRGGKPSGTPNRPCRVVASSNGSECGKGQPFNPYDELVGITTTQNVANFPILNGLLAVGAIATGTSAAVYVGAVLYGPAAIAAAGALSIVALGLTGAYDLTADFHVRALPDQQQQSIYNIFVQVNKRTRLFGLFRVQFDLLNFHADSNNAMLPLDSGSGGIISLAAYAQQAGSTLPAGIVKQQQFAFVPTYSALNITPGGTAALRATYSPGTSVGTPFANFRTAARENEGHIEYTALNSTWMLRELRQDPLTLACAAFCAAAPTISGRSTVCSGGSTYSIAGLPSGTTVNWQLGPVSGVTPLTGTGQTFTPVFTGGSASHTTLQATISSDCGQFTIKRNIDAGVALRVTQIPDTRCGMVAQANITGVENVVWVVNGQEVPSLIVEDGFREFWEYQGGQVTVALRGTNVCTGALLTSIAVTKSGPATGDKLCPQRPAAQPTATLYPNPAKETVDVHTENADAAHPVTVRLYDGYGQPRAEQTSTGAASVRLATGQLPAGLYFVHILRGREVLSRQQLRIEK